jgi:hypothetical protein
MEGWEKILRVTSCGLTASDLRLTVFGRNEDGRLRNKVKGKRVKEKGSRYQEK